MACPNNIAPGKFLMDSLMGGSPSFRGEGYSSNPGMYIHTAAEYGYSVMRNIGKVGPASLSKRDELPPGAVPLSGFQDAPYLSATWTPGSKSSRDEQPVAHCLQPCSFPAGNVKEEAFCCLYQDDSNKGKQTTESATYIRLGDNSCRPEQSASSSGCFQVYGGERPQQHDQQFPSGFSLTHLATSGESASESPISCTTLSFLWHRGANEREGETLFLFVLNSVNPLLAFACIVLSMDFKPFCAKLKRGLGSFMLLGIASWLGNKKLP